MSEADALADQYTGDTRTDDALKLLCQRATGLSKKQRFDDAETCRDRLWEANGAALSAIIAANEIIENGP
jgi:hypothetical protein